MVETSHCGLLNEYVYILHDQEPTKVVLSYTKPHEKKIGPLLVLACETKS